MQVQADKIVKQIFLQVTGNWAMLMSVKSKLRE